MRASRPRDIVADHPAANLPRLEEMSLVLETLGSTSWGEAARAWLREGLRPGDLRRFTEFDDG